MIDESLLISVNMMKAVGDRRSYIASDSASRLVMEFFKHIDTGGLVAKVHFGADAEGPPGLAHNAAVSGALSEAMIFTAWSQGHAVLAMRMNTAFKQMMPSNASAWIETKLELDGPRITIHASLSTTNGADIVLYAEAEGMFMAIPAAKFGVDGQKVAQMFAALS
jgi:hypothetical protein